MPPPISYSKVLKRKLILTVQNFQQLFFHPLQKFWYVNCVPIIFDVAMANHQIPYRSDKKINFLEIPVILHFFPVFLQMQNLYIS